MEELIVDCRTGQQVRRIFILEEERRRLAEIALAEEQELVMERQRIRAQLLQAAGNLERARALREEGVLRDEDVRELEGEVERLKGEVKNTDHSDERMRGRNHSAY